MKFLVDRAVAPAGILLLAHGAGAPMDHAWMREMTLLLIERGVSVVRFEFGFMAGRRNGGTRRPAPKAETLVDEYAAAVEQVAHGSGRGHAIFIGGKSLGGRVASLAAPAMYDAGQIRGVVCLGYPFHPQGRPEVLRTAHLAQFECPALIVQGARDALGSQAEAADYGLDTRIEMVWLDDGDHDLRPRKASGRTAAQHMAAAAERVAAFIRSTA